MSEIDVKDCCYYNSDNEPYCCELYVNECEAQNCYFQQLQQLKVENKKLSTQNYYLDKANLGLAEENEKYLQCLDEIEEQVEDIISEKCNKPCEECTGRPLCDKYYILQIIKQAKEGEK